MLELKQSTSIKTMASRILEEFDYDIKKCKAYVIEQYLEAADDEINTQYWLEVGCDVEKQFKIWKTNHQ